MEQLYFHILEKKLVKNDINLIDNIISFIKCKSCNNLEDKCQCETCVSCDQLKTTDEIFVCDARCKGDVICEDCSRINLCTSCGENVCDDCIYLECDNCDSLVCCYCENSSTCICDN